MKKIYTLSALGLITAGSIAFTSMQSSGVVKKFNKHQSEILFSGGGQSGLTGAPGEANCTQCHTGSTQDGTGVVSIDLGSGSTEYTPGSTETITLGILGMNPKNGFSAVALDGTNAMAGSFTSTDATTQTFSGGGNMYVSHTAAGNSLPGWQFDWTAPAAGAGDVTFYAAYNQADNGGSTASDVIYLVSQTFTEEASTASIEDIKAETFNVGYSPNENALVLSFDSEIEANASVNVVSLSGQSVFFENLNDVYQGESEEKVYLDKEYESGIYIVQLFLNNKVSSKKIYIK